MTSTHLCWCFSGQVGKVLGERWKALSAKQKEPYDAKAKTDKERYESEKASYNVSRPLTRCIIAQRSAHASPLIQANDEEEEEE